LPNRIADIGLPGRSACDVMAGRQHREGRFLPPPELNVVAWDRWRNRSGADLP
jgi:hypothetical protein